MMVSSVEQLVNFFSDKVVMRMPMSWKRSTASKDQTFTPLKIKNHIFCNVHTYLYIHIFSHKKGDLNSVSNLRNDNSV